MSAEAEHITQESEAQESEHFEHEISLAPETIFNVAGFSVTNSLLNSWMTVIILIICAVVLFKKIKQVPKGMQNVFEMIIEAVFGVMDSVTGSREKSTKFFPLVFTLFIFILINNWLGILPGVGSIGYVAMHEGHGVFVPFLRGATADLNTTLSLALLAVIGSNLLGFITVGVWKYFNKFISVKELISIPRKVLKDPSVLIVNPIKFFVGLIEIISEIAKVASLSFRLFGNVFAGEVLLASIAVIFAWILPVPFMFLEILVGLIQALIFSMLTLVYLSVATTAEEHG
ncbi:F0F1 ATP synthase subunit A [Patescibacteria group bacterium]|nr:F0F1 ATP synthase subunit A [Patescibacteria group bacterium]